MGHLAELIAADAAAGDALLLYGAVGAGKSAFCRAFVRAIAQDPSLPVPSPTFLLQNVYEAGQPGMPPVHHFDLYRLTPNSDFGRLDLRQSFASAVSLVEWAERLESSAMPEGGHLAMEVEVIPEAQHTALAPQLARASSSGRSADDNLEEDEEDPYSDRRWRWVRLEAIGPRWAARMPALVASVEAEGRLSGLIQFHKEAST